MRAFYCDEFVLPLPETHRFPMAKYRLLRERVVAERILAADKLQVPDAAPVAVLEAAHTSDYVSAVMAGTLPEPMQRRIGFPWSPAMVERSRRSVGATLAAARAALEDGVATNLAGGTHHAFADRGEGYCVFNDVAVAARTLVRQQRASRVLVIDGDVHQGNGTASIFAGDAAVFTFSIHGAKNFPFRKEESDLDVALEDGTGDQPYLDALASGMTAAFERQQPDFVFYVAGADPYVDDRLGRLALSIDGLAERDRLVFEACRRAGVPVAVSMAGGYATDVNAIVTIHANTIRAAAALTPNP